MPISDIMFDKQEWANFWIYFRPTNEQQRVAIEILRQHILESDPALLTETAAWVAAYREKPPQPVWPISKEQLGQVMGCLPKYLPDELMNDLAECCKTFDITGPRLAYFLGQCGEESGGLRYPMEIASGAAYEWRSDLGNNHAGDGIKFAGQGWLQCTGRANTQRFADYLSSIGKPDPKVMEVGKTYTANRYPWTISGFWWHANNMNELCDQFGWDPTDRDIDYVGRRVNGVMPPRGAAERISYTRKALKELRG